MTRRLPRLLCTSALLACSLAIAIPVLARPAIGSTQPAAKPAEGTDEAELWYAMERLELQLQQSPLLVRDPTLNAYTRDVLCKVTQAYCGDLRLYIVDLPFFNASMAPNGAMIIWTGSLLRIQNEAQLALVLGHESGHYRERHTLQQWRKMKRSSAFLSTFGVLASGAGVGVAGMAANLAGLASMMKFSRDKEREADRIGFAQLLAQGYDPRAGVELWEGMVREENARDYGKPIPVFSSHPRTEERRDDLKAAAAMTRAGGELAIQPYRQATRALLHHWLENELSRRMFTTSIQVISDLRQAGAPEDAGLYTFFLGEAHRRRNKGDDRSRAAQLYATAVGQADAPADAWREHGLVLREAGSRVASAAALRRYLELSPAAQDRAFITTYLAELESTP